MTRHLNLPLFTSSADTAGLPTSSAPAPDRPAPPAPPALIVSTEARRRLFVEVESSSAAGCLANEIRWLDWLDGAENRVPVLVLPHASADLVPGESPWFPVAPMWTDAESAIPGDLILDSTESTTGISWRVAFSHQTEVPDSLLGAILGHLTPTGARLVARACDGDVPAARTGSAFESVNDPRIHADEWIGQLLAHAMERAAEQWFEEAVPVIDETVSPAVLPAVEVSEAPTDAPSPELAIGPATPVVTFAKVIRLRPQFRPRPSAFSLAAATHSFDDECVLVAEPVAQPVADPLADPAGSEPDVVPAANSEFEAVIALDIASNELRMEVRSLAADLTDAAAFVVVNFSGGEQVVVQVQLRRGTFVLNSELPVGEHDIETVEIRLP